METNTKYMVWESAGLCDAELERTLANCGDTDTRRAQFIDVLIKDHFGQIHSAHAKWLDEQEYVQPTPPDMG